MSLPFYLPDGDDDVLLVQLLLQGLGQLAGPSYFWWKGIKSLRSLS
jgi:hypothetical protein